MSAENDQMKKRCQEIAELLRPACVARITNAVQYGVEARIEYNSDGTVNIEAAAPDDPRALLALLHEYGHAVRGHGNLSRYTWPYHFKEYECEQWALEQIAKLQPEWFPPLQAMSRIYIMGTLRADFPAEEGLINEVLDYLDPDQQEQIVRELQAYREQLSKVHPRPKAIADWPIQRARP